MTYQDYRHLADRAVQLAFTSSTPAVSEALMAVASDYLSKANRLSRTAVHQHKDKKEEDLPDFGD